MRAASTPTTHDLGGFNDPASAPWGVALSNVGESPARVTVFHNGVLVHHGWFWRGEDPRMLGPRRERMALVLAHRLNLFAFHLPLDVHPEVGNNAQLGARLGWPTAGRFGDEGLGCWHDFSQPQPVAQVTARLAAVLRRALNGNG